MTFSVCNSSSIEVRIKLCGLGISVVFDRKLLLVSHVLFRSFYYGYPPLLEHNITLPPKSFSHTLFLSLLLVFHSSYMQGEPYNLTTLNISVVSGPMQIFVVLNNLIRMCADNNIVRRHLFSTFAQNYLWLFLME